MEDQEGARVVKILEGNVDRSMQLDRTNRGACARCGQQPTEHADGKCSDGQGSFTWAHTREQMAGMIDRLEALLGKRRPQ